MSYLWRAIKTQILWRHLSHYSDVKDHAVNYEKVPRPKKLHCFGKLGDFYLAMQTENSPERFVWLGCKSFTGGLVLSWIFFFFSITALHVSAKTATVLSATIATVLSFLLSFSSVVRCYVLLLMPQLFSKRGRQALTAFAFLLAVTGPARNATHNLGVLSSSLACGQERLEQTMKQVVDMVREPLIAIKASLIRLKQKMKQTVEPIKGVVSRLTRTFSAIFGVVKEVSSWLGSIVSVCNKKTGTPSHRCIKSLDDAIDDCKIKLGVMQFMCGMVSVVKPLCFAAKAVDTLCFIMDLVSDAVVEVAKRRLAAFRQHVKDLLAVSIEIQHSVKMEDSVSRSLNDVITSILAQIDKKMEGVKRIFKISVMVPGFAFVLLILKVQYYRHKFLTADHYDNRYLNRRLVQIDLARMLRKLPTVLPLELNERALYTTAGSLRLVHGERKRLFNALVFLVVTTIQICTYLLADYGIFWTILVIRKQGQETTIAANAPTAKVDVQGTGTLAALYKQLGSVFQPPTASYSLDLVGCLPEPRPPDFRLYIQIGMLLGGSWVMAIAEPHCARLRHIVMSHYYPERAKLRAAWLHNHILLSRGPLTLYARKRICADAQLTGGLSIGSIFQRLTHRVSILGKIFGRKITACVICATMKSKERVMMRCPGRDCSAVYCSRCRQESLTHCIICYETLHIPYNTTILEAIDSSDEEDIEGAISNGTDTDYPESETTL